MKPDRPQLRVVSGSDDLRAKEQPTPEAALWRDWVELDKRAFARAQELWPHDKGAMAMAWADKIMCRGIDYLIAAGFPMEEVPARCAHYIIRRQREREAEMLGKGDAG